MGHARGTGASSLPDLSVAKYGQKHLTFEKCTFSFGRDPTSFLNKGTARYGLTVLSPDCGLFYPSDTPAVPVRRLYLT